MWIKVNFLSDYESHAGVWLLWLNIELCKFEIQMYISVMYLCVQFATTSAFCNSFEDSPITFISCLICEMQNDPDIYNIHQCCICAGAAALPSEIYSSTMLLYLAIVLVAMCI